MTDPAQKLRRLIAERLGVPCDQVVASARFTEDLGADELDRMECVIAVEDEFGVAIADDEIEELATVGDFDALLARKLNERTAA